MGLFDKFFGKKSGADNAANVPANVSIKSVGGAAKTPAPKQQDKSKSKSKKKTLPKDFEDLLKAGDMSALKAVFATCDLDARGDYYQMTALGFKGIPDELVRYLVEQGADINARDRYQNTPLHHQIGRSTAELLLDLGADIEAQESTGETPLHTAAQRFNPQGVRLLIERGADINAKNKRGHTPLAKALGVCANSHIAQMAEVAKILLDAGAAIAPEMQASVKRIGKDFEFHREAFNKELLAETESGLARLYELFGVEPVARRRVHDGVSPITVAAARWQDQNSELWDYLVPSKGHALTAQGEAIRIAGRVSDEILGNGGANWDDDYRKMLDSLVKLLGFGTPLSPAEIAEAAELSKQLHSRKGGGEPARLVELAVSWVLANPNPISLDKPNYKR